MYLRPRVAAWRYQKGQKSSIAANLSAPSGGAGGATAATTAATTAAQAAAAEAQQRAAAAAAVAEAEAEEDVEHAEQLEGVQGPGHGLRLALLAELLGNHAGPSRPATLVSSKLAASTCPPVKPPALLPCRRD